MSNIYPGCVSIYTGSTPPLKHPHCDVKPPHYPYNRPVRDSYTFCCCGRVPNPPSSKFPTSGPFQGSGFALNDTNPYLIDTTYTSYGQVLCFSESVYTKVTQRKDTSCINLAATFDMTDTNLSNTVRMDFLEKYISKKYCVLNGVLPIIKNDIKFKVYYTITDMDGGVTHQGTAVSTSQDNYFHFTDIRDMHVLSARNVIIENIPAMTYQGLYTITIDRVEAYVNVIKTQDHLVDDMNPYYTFTDNNMKITLQHDAIVTETADEELLIATCEVNKSFDYQANVTTRLRMTFTAFMSSLIACGDTSGVWESLNSPTEELVSQLIRDVDMLQEEVKMLHEMIGNQNLLIQKLSDRITKLEEIPLATVFYKKDFEFVDGQITWVEYGKLYQVTEDYVASGDFDTDVASGKLIPLSRAGVDLSPIETEIQNLSESIETISNDVNTNKTNIESNTDSINGLDERVSTLEGTNEDEGA